MYQLALDHYSPLSLATYDPTTGELYLEFDYDRLLDTQGEWRDGRHIDAVTFMGEAYPIIIHADDGPRDENGRYIFDRDTVDNTFTLNIGTGHDPADGSLSFGLSDREDGTRQLFSFDLEEVEDTGGNAGPTLVYAVNAGGDTFVADNGVEYEADIYGNGRNYSTTADIGGTTDDGLYQTEAWAKTLTYEMAVANGTYDVELNFAEIWGGARAAGKRVIDLYVEDELVFDSLDLSDQVGFREALDMVGQVTVEDGSLSIRAEGEVQNAKLAGFSVWEAEGAIEEGFVVGSLYNDLSF